MRKLFLINDSLNVDYDDFISGISELIQIKKEREDTFLKNAEVYKLENYIKLCENRGQDESNISNFIEQLSPCETVVENEENANSYCGRDFNALLGIDFSQITAKDIKKVKDNSSYQKWSFHYLSTIDKINTLLNSTKTTNGFTKDLDRLNRGEQHSIIKYFEKAIKRGLKSPLYPDTKIIKDVTPKNEKFKLRELKIYSPTALRVYFHEASDCVYLVGIGGKTGSQNQDIMNMYKKLKEIKS